MRTLQEDSRLHTRTIVGLVSPTPSVIYGDVIVIKNGPGVFNLIFPSLRTVLSATVSNLSGAPYLITCAVGGNTMLVWCWNLSGSQVDPTQFSFSAVGYPK